MTNDVKAAMGKNKANPAFTREKLFLYLTLKQSSYEIISLIHTNHMI